MQKDGISFPLRSPDGNRILFRQAPFLFVIEADKDWAQQKSESLPSFPDLNRRFVAWDWSADGKRLAGSFSDEPMDAGFFTFKNKGFELLTKMSNFPRWFSDRRRMIFGLDNKLFITDFDTKKVRELPIKPTGELQSLGVSRDDRLINYSVATHESDIWLLDTNPPNQ